MIEKNICFSFDERHPRIEKHIIGDIKKNQIGLIIGIVIAGLILVAFLGIGISRLAP